MMGALCSDVLRAALAAVLPQKLARKVKSRGFDVESIGNPLGNIQMLKMTLFKQDKERETRCLY